MALLTTADDFEDIRRLLDMQEANPTNIPDTVIQRRVYLGSAEMQVKERVPGAEALTGDDLERVKIAAACYTAAKMVPSFRRLTREQYTNDSSFQYQQISNDELIDWLNSEANRNIDQVLNPGSISDQVTRRSPTPASNRNWAYERGGPLRRRTEAGAYRRKTPR